MEGELAATIEQAPGAHRPHPARRQPGPQRAGHRRDQLPVPVRPPRPHRLRRLDRLRVQAGDDDRSRPRLATPTCRAWSPESDRRRRTRARSNSIPAERTEEDADMTITQARIHRPGHHGHADGGPPAEGRAPALRALSRPAVPDSDRRRRGARPAPAARKWRRTPTSSSPWCRTRRMWPTCCSARTASPQGLAKGKIVVDMSSISPIETKDFAKKINELGCEYLDAPVSGGEVGAKNADAAIMVGGNEAAFDAGQAAVRADGQEHHAGRRQRRRPDHQGREPDHRRAEHRGGGRSAAVRGQGRRRSRPRCARR